MKVSLPRLLLLAGLLAVAGVVTWLPSFGRAATTDEGRERVNVWSWNTAALALASVEPDFEARHPDIDVAVERNGTMLAPRLRLSLIAGKGGPDVAQLQEREAPGFCTTGRLVDLTSWAAKYRDDFPASFWSSVVSDGRVRAIPWDIGPVAVYYKRWVLKRYDIDPDAIETWDDLIAAGRALSERSGGRSKMMPLQPGDMTDLLQILMQQRGGGIYDAAGRVTLGQRRNAEVLRLLTKLLDADITVPIGTFGNEFLGSLSTDDVACYVGAAWLGQNLKDSGPKEHAGDWGVFRLPAFEPGGLRNSNLGGSVLIVPESATQPEAAQKFVEYALCTVPGQIKQFKEFGLFPAYLPAQDDPFFKEPDPFYGGQKVNELFAEDFDKVPPLTRTSDWNEAERLLRQSLSRFATDRPDPAAFLRELAGVLASQTRREVAPLDANGDPIPPAPPAKEAR